ncbi:MAG: hypothetical protein E4G94_08365 [ANME-2 cluster archaeon]|nr:MAG: hypothetical protein E4G94_08365 [ANME-2 cluster archaeon]
MNKFVLLLVVGLFFAVSIANLSVGQKNGGLGHENANVPDIPLPKSFNDSEWLPQMFEMEMHFTGIVVNVNELDFDNASIHFEAFREEYEESSKQVPEWSGYFPIKPVNELESALETEDLSVIMPAVGKVGESCHNCHVVYMAEVQQRYHWEDFSEVDNFSVIMQILGGSMTGIRIDLDENQVDKAQVQFQVFNDTFQRMKTTCIECHDSERKYYIDASVQAMIDDLGQELEEDPINMTNVSILSGGIGYQSCYKCHLVHVPAAFTQLTPR